MSTAVILGMLLFGASHVWAQQQDPGTEDLSSQKSRADADTPIINRVCKFIELAAHTWKLPPAFFARLIWKESRFDPNAVSPAGASGIAQFMPGTARLRNLKDPFEPRSAIAASAHYLSDLRDQFGSLGLAAAAYNAGPNRVLRWQGGNAKLPAETQNYVASITGISAREWDSKVKPKVEYTLNKKLPFLDACLKLPIRRSKPRSQYATAPWQPWGAHLTADWSPSKALAHYAALQRKYPAILADQTPMVLRVINPSFGRAPRFEIRIGQPDRAKAKKFCDHLNKLGGPCLVTKTKQQS
jgi:hypothetical protein